jgi:hypothetical protein
MKNSVLSLLILVILLSACSQPAARTVAPTIKPAILTQIAPTQSPTEEPTVEIMAPTATSEAQTTVIILPTQSASLSTPAPVLSGFIITASRGNLTIHRGPGFEYNIIGYFLTGQYYNVVGRDEKGTWLMVSLSAGKVAWISNMTSYTDVNGNVPGLPVVTEDPAVPAYIYNCTGHVLTTKPGNYRIQPWSKEKVNPYDFYFIYDNDVTMSDGYHPVVDKVTVTEGEIANVHKDGDGNTFTCTVN